MMNKNLILFHFYIIALLSLSYVVHHNIIDYDYLFLFYTINLVLAVIIYWLFFFTRNKQEEYMGFYFLLGTILKFIVFFTIVFPIFKNDDGDVSKMEFFSFFTPYLLSLFVETTSLISLLHSAKK